MIAKAATLMLMIFIVALLGAAIVLALVFPGGKGKGKEEK